jgi:hypothetical protein
MPKKIVSMDLWNNNRAVVMAAMHRMGDLRGALSDGHWSAFYCLCDGFGEVNFVDAAIRLQWDWSHVRDSSDDALAEVASKVRAALSGHVRVDVDGQVVDV